MMVVRKKAGRPGTVAKEVLDALLADYNTSELGYMRLAAKYNLTVATVRYYVKKAQAAAAAAEKGE